MARYDPRIHHRRSIRLKGYDYSQPGLYFITICTQNLEHFFGEIRNGIMGLNDAGIMVHNEWISIPERFPNVKLHEFVVMPNHFHSIMEITVGATLVVAPRVAAPNDAQINENARGQPGQPQGVAPTGKNKPKTVGDIVGAFQSIVTVKYIDGVKNNHWRRFNGKLWQRNYWEHIIRNENEYIRISEYIKNNPLNWKDDKFYG
ncbi:MAG: transposase [Calditrichaeota bacterium]|nr:transposase [Calditrichota bacterium]